MAAHDVSRRCSKLLCKFWQQQPRNMHLGSWAQCRHISNLFTNRKSNFQKFQMRLHMTTSQPEASSVHPPLPHSRLASTATTTAHVPQAGIRSEQLSGDPSKLAEDDLRRLFSDIRQELQTENVELKHIANYYLDGKGKALRPVIVFLMARAVNVHEHGTSKLLSSQHKIAMIVEMIHSATLVHDDVIDASDMRRGKPSVNLLCGQRKAIFAGDYMISAASCLLARIRNDDAANTMIRTLHDLVIGEFMQLNADKSGTERFAHYLEKTYNKTASLIANSCKAVAILSGGSGVGQELAFQYGRNVGIAFQLVDDLLDFVSNAETLGKPAAADLRLGLATAPVLFACEKFPELEKLISRKFSEAGDVEWALEAVLKSDGLKRTRFLAEHHCQAAVHYIQQLTPSPEQEALYTIADVVLNRIK